MIQLTSPLASRIVFGMQNNQQSDGGMAPNIPKPLLQMQSLDALLQSSHMQNSLLQHQYRQNQVSVSYTSCFPYVSGCQCRLYVILCNHCYT